jgi:predicted transcriptional regulator
LHFPPQKVVDGSRRNAYPWGMDAIPIRPERKAQLEDYAQRHGQEPAAALDDVLAEALEWEQQDYQEAVEGIRQGYEEFKAGRARPVEEAFEELREKHGLPR